jgi:VanZ family protein
MAETRLRLHRLWLAIGWILVGLVVYATLTPNPPDLELGIPIWDKLSHFLAYVLLMGWFVQIYHTKENHLRLVIFLVLLGVILEILQLLGGVRTMEFADMIANTLGVLVGYALGKTRFAYALSWMEKFYLVMSCS